jgi:hypothetical protein
MPKKEYVSLKTLLENAQKMPFKSNQTYLPEVYSDRTINEEYNPEIFSSKNIVNSLKNNTINQSFAQIKLNEFRNKQKEKQIQDLALKLIRAKETDRKLNQTINQTTNKLKSVLEENQIKPTFQYGKTQKRLIAKSNSSDKKSDDIFSGMKMKDALETLKFLDYVSKITNSKVPFKPKVVGNNVSATHSGWTVSEALFSSKNRTPIIGLEIYHPAPSRSSSMKKRANKSKKYFD